MADLFAPKISGNIGYERPVQMPSTLEAIGDVTKNLVSVFSPRGGGQTQPDQDPLLQKFAEELEIVNNIRQEKGDMAAKLAERRVAKNFAGAGIDFDKDYQRIYETTTGQPWAGYGRTTEDYMKQQALEDPDVQQNFLAASVALGEDSTSDQRLEWAMNAQAEHRAAALTIQRAQTQQQVNWTQDLEAKFNTQLNGFAQRAFGNLRALEQTGRPITAQDIANTKAQWSVVQASLSRPSGVSDQQWKATQTKINNITNMLDNFEKASSSQVALDSYSKALSDFVFKQGGGDTNSAIAAATVLKDPTVVADMVSDDITEIFSSVSKAGPEAFSVTSLQLFPVVQESSAASPLNRPSANTIIDKDTMPKEIKALYEDKSPSELFELYNASEKLQGMLNPNDMNKPEAKEQFASAALSMGLAMSLGNEDGFVSPQFLQKIVGNKGFLDKLNMYAQLDPEGGIAVRSSILTGLAEENFRQTRNLASLENNIRGAEWDGSKYTINREALKERGIGEGRFSQFQRLLDTHYGGDVTEAARNGFAKMRDFADVIQIGGFFNIGEALERRKAISLIGNTTGAIRVPEEDDPIADVIRQSEEETQQQQQPTEEAPTPQARPQTNRDYFTNIRRVAFELAQEEGFPNPDVIANLAAAQSSLETGFGKSVEGGNLFGIKGEGPAGSVSTPTREVIDGEEVRITDEFRAYNTQEESIRDFLKLLSSNERYSAVANAPDIRSAVEAQGKSGYATDPEYADKLARLIQQYAGGS